jgi:hypothetical protein
MSVKVSYVSVWNMLLEIIHIIQFLFHKFWLFLYFGINGPTVLHTTTGTGVMAHSWAPGMYCFSHHSLKLAVNLILDIWGSQYCIVSL